MSETEQPERLDRRVSVADIRQIAAGVAPVAGLVGSQRSSITIGCGV